MSNDALLLHDDRHRRRLIVSFCGLAVLLFGDHARAQESHDGPELLSTRAAHAARLAANPRGLTLAARTSAGHVQFAQGEVITLDLEFRDDSDVRYPFDARAYDRSGRLGIDRLVVAPSTGVADPLQDYYRAMGFGFLGGGVSTPPVPLDGRRTVSLDANEWVRFVRPGAYAVYIESHRFLDPQAAASGRHAAVTVVSNLLVLTITPPRTDGTPRASLSARALRFADSAAAAGELARRLLELTEPTTRVGTEGHDIRFGLLATPHRAEALAALRAGLAIARRAVDEVVPEVAAFLDVMIAVPRQPNENGAAANEPAERLRHRMSLHACRLASWQREALAAGLRGGPADVARASVAFAHDAPSHCPSLPQVNLARGLPPVFAQLPPAQQRLMLSYRWGQVAGRAMLPLLRQLVSVDPPVDEDTRDLAFVRLGELAPGEAARVSRDDIVSGRFRFSARSLRVRPQDRRVVTQALAAHLARARATQTPLWSLQDGREPGVRGLLPVLARVGTVREFEVLLTWPQAEKTSCPARASLIALSLAVDRERGDRLLREALSDSRSRCREAILDDLARSWPQRLPETVAIDALWHEHRGVAAGAAQALARIGTDAARQALWRRLDEWHALWAGREDDLRRVSPHVDDPATDERALEPALREALLRGRGWITTADDRMRVRESCVTAACREEFSPFRGGPPVKVVLVQAEEWTGQTVYRVDGHLFQSAADVVDRLALYPKTVTIAWDAGRSHAPGRAKALHQVIAAAGATRGLRVLPQPPAP